MMRWIMVAVLACLWPFQLASAAPTARELWFYQATNLLVDNNIDALEALWRRAAAEGYTHVLLADSKFARLNEMPPRYFEHVQRVKQLAKSLHMQIVPAVFPVGYSNDILSQDPNLAEGLPVRDQPLVVRNNQALPAPDSSIALTGRMLFKDDAVALAGRTATITNNPGNARFTYQRALPRFRCYRVSVWIKTNGYSGTPEIKALADGASLQYQSLAVKPTQDWKQYHVIFNTLDHNSINLYFGVWGQGRGTLQWRDWSIEEVALLNVLRRDGTPCVVRHVGDDGKTLREGIDYDPIIDPGLGTKPWRGEYDVDHAPPILKTHGLPDGTRLLVSWYHPVIFNAGQVSACPSAPAFDALLADQARRMKALWDARGYMMSHDEIRALGWDESCLKRKLTPGKILADNARRCVELLKGSKVCVWSDMFDPFHNAVNNYYLVNGDLTGSWEGLDPSVNIVNWNFGHRDQSLRFFADKGHPQIIAGYYDHPPGRIRQWLASADKIPSVVGVMYTTWERNYADLEAFARLCR